MKKLFILLFITTSLFASIGTIMAAKGKAIVERGSSQKVYAIAGLKLLEGDTIVTQAKSRVQVMLLDETVITVGAKSSFSFEEYAFNGKNSKVTMTASRGFFRSVTGRIGKLAPQRFKVKTASATIGIRGTDFWGITGGETERVTCNKGAIVIEYDGKTIEVGAGSYASYGPKGVKQGKTNSGNKNSDKKETKKRKKKDKQNKDKDKDEDNQEDDSDGNSEESGTNEEGQDTQEESTDTQDTSTPELPDQDTNIGDIPTEDIADVTQVIEEKIVEPFTMTPGSEDRPVEY